jgi:signal transduction histidine kinase
VPEFSNEERRLQEHNKIQEEFIIVTANEMRFSVQPILGLSEFLLFKKGNIEQYKELLNHIIRHAKRIQILTENTIDATKIENQSLKVYKECFKLNDIIANVIADLKKEEENNKQRKIKFTYSSNNDNIIVNADAVRVTRVVSNLLSNANKFTSEGEISVSITSDKTEQQIIVRVRDTGLGIRPEIMPRLFTKIATKMNLRLGLYVSKGIVEAHGGKMWAENNSDGIGATFSFTLPTGE